jgi:excisionase family DNA binding protein
MMTLNEDRFYSPAEVAEYLSVNVQTVRRWIHAGKLGAYRIGKYWRVSREQVEEFLAAHKVSH